jgi:hypothetical protein
MDEHKEVEELAKHLLGIYCTLTDLNTSWETCTSKEEYLHTASILIDLGYRKHPSAGLVAFVNNEETLCALASILSKAIIKYHKVFGQDVHGTQKQCEAMLVFGIEEICSTFGVPAGREVSDLTIANAIPLDYRNMGLKELSLAIKKALESGGI